MKIKPCAGLFVLFLLVLPVGIGCQTVSQTKRPDPTRLAAAITPSAGTDVIKETRPYDEPEGAEGIARYYAKRFNGRRTASGEIYTPRKMTAAHPSLPLGTKVRVENLANNKSVTVRINDRCRDHEGVFIDLSREAARQLGFLGKGKASVRISIVEKEALPARTDDDHEHKTAQE